MSLGVNESERMIGRERVEDDDADFGRLIPLACDAFLLFCFNE